MKKTGIEIPISAKVIAARSQMDRGRKADRIPIGIPTNNQMIAAPTASWIVTHIRSIRHGLERRTEHEGLPESWPAVFVTQEQVPGEDVELDVDRLVQSELLLDLRHDLRVGLLSRRTGWRWRPSRRRGAGRRWST